MLKELYEAAQLTFITTERCTASCPHCIMRSTPEKTAALTYDDMRRVIEERMQLGPLRIVIFTGGEPTLLGEDLYRTISFCRDHDILTRVVSNAHWAKTKEGARETLRKMRDAGLDELNFSMDDYHAPFVPIENVKTAWEAVKGMGFSAVVIANCHGEDDRIQPDFIYEYLGEKIQTRDADHRHGYHPEEKYDPDGTLYILCEGRLQKSGRASSALTQEEKYYHPENEIGVRGGCGGILYQPCVSFSKKLWACCGLRCEENPVLCLGDLNKESMDDIMERADDSVLLHALHVIGPVDLIEMVTSVDPTIQFAGEYHTICEACWELTMNERAMEVLRSSIPWIARLLRNAEKQRQEQADATKTASIPSEGQS